MEIIAMLISLNVLTFLYRRMIARDVPEPIGRKQAIVPVLLGVVSLPLALIITFGCVGSLINIVGYSPTDYPLLAQSAMSAFLIAGLPEELAKFLMIMAAFKIFRTTVRNVYEYVLIGAAVGFGFTLPEEALYGSDLISFLLRLEFIAGHFVFGIIMAYYLGMAEHKKITNQGSSAKEYLFALLIPILTHTLYDACTSNNKFLYHEDEDMQMIGIIIGLVGAIAAFVIQIVILLKFKKNAEKLCSLRLLQPAAPLSGLRQCAKSL